METKKYRAVIVTPLGTITGPIVDLTQEDYKELQSQYADIGSLEGFSLLTSEGEVFLHKNLIKRSLIRLEYAGEGSEIFPPTGVINYTSKMKKEMNQTFETFLLEYTGRDIEHHISTGTTGLEFARHCWDRASKLNQPLAKCEPEAARQPRNQSVSDADIQPFKFAGLRNGKIVELANDKLSLNHDHISQIVEIELDTLTRIK